MREGNVIKYVTSTPAKTRFLWESKILDSSLLLAGAKASDIYNVFVYDSPKDAVFAKEYLKELSKAGINIITFHSELLPLTREYGIYPATVKPFGFMKLLASNPSLEKSTIMQLDTDVVFLDSISGFNNLEHQVVGSKTNFYQSLGLIKSQDEGGYEKFVKDLSRITGVSSEELERLDESACGAQVIIGNPYADLYKEITENCYKIKKAMEDDVPKAQSWLAEMFASYYAYYKHGYNPKYVDWLGFSWSSDPLTELNKWNILHDSGVSKESAAKNSLFYKNNYIKGNYPNNNNLDISSLKINSLGTAYAVLVDNMDDYTETAIKARESPDISTREYIVERLSKSETSKSPEKFNNYIELAFKEFPTSLSILKV